MEHNPFQAGDYNEYEADSPAVDQSYELSLATPLTRFAGVMLDNIILMVPIGILWVIIFMVAGDGEEIGVPHMVGSVISLLMFAAWCVITLRLVKANGQSIAKKMLGIRVVRSNGEVPSVSRIILHRNLSVILLGMVPFVGYLFNVVDGLMVFSENNQTIHDRIADTMVVDA